MSPTTLSKTKSKLLFIDEKQFDKLNFSTQFIGKKNLNDDGLKILPVHIHLLDTGAVMAYLFETRVSTQEKRLFKGITGSDDITRALFILAGLLHDIGKLTPSFQYRILRNTNLCLSPDYDSHLNSYSSDTRHDELGMLILLKMGYAEFFASLIGAHHGKTQDIVGKKLKDKLSYYSDALYGDHPANWSEIWSLLNESMQEIAGIKMNQLPDLSADLLLIMAGYLSLADWLASNTAYFPLLAPGQALSLEDFQKRAEIGLEKIGLTKVWNHTSELPIISPQKFKEIFGFSPNPMQSEAIALASQIQKPGLFIIEAPMGLGKTEAALEVADIFSQKTGAGGIYIGLPTQATANGLLTRFEKWALKETDSPIIFSLAHSNASLNTDFKKLPISLNSAESNEDDKLIAHQWLQQSRLRLFSDFVLGTIDTSLMATLSHKYVAFRHAGLAGKIVILDEVHSYDAYTQSFLNNLLRWLGVYKVPVILLSATLSSNIRDQLISSYLSGRTGSVTKREIPFHLHYPSLIYTDGNDVFQSNQEIIVPASTIQVSISLYADDAEEIQVISKLIHENMDEGGCVGIIVNSVKKAQKISNILTQQFPAHKVIDFHSRFTQSDRQCIEKQILKCVDKSSSSEDRNNVVIVGTQVLEQSLDLDFDYLISELAPIDLLIQRTGRLHRHPRKNRPQKLSTPVLTVLDTQNDYDPASKRIYSQLILHRTRDHLPQRFNFPNDIPDLVSAVYDQCDEIEDDQETMDYKIRQSNQVHKASNFQLSFAWQSRLRNRGLNHLMQETYNNIHSAENSVRLIEPGLECIVIKEVNKTIVSPDGTPFSWESGGLNIDENSVMEELLTKSIRIPLNNLEDIENDLFTLQNTRVLTPIIPEQLRKTPFIILDENNQLKVDNVLFDYDPYLGFSANKIGEDTSS